jgi:hypothetical protein
VVIEGPCIDRPLGVKVARIAVFGRLGHGRLELVAEIG